MEQGERGKQPKRAVVRLAEREAAEVSGEAGYKMVIVGKRHDKVYGVM
jgi:hypothetical protein